MTWLKWLTPVAAFVLTPLRFLKDRPVWFMVVLLAVVAWRLYAQERGLADVRDALPPGGFQAVAAGSVVVRTESVYIREPNWAENLFNTDAAKRYKAEITADIRGEIKDALEDRGEEVAELTVIQATSEGDSARFPVGGEVDHPGASVMVVEPDVYRLWIKPRDYRLTLVETKKGSSYAELEDLTMDQLLKITEFKHRRISPGWDTSWLGWGLEVGLADDGKGGQGFNAGAEVIPLTFRKGTTRIDLLRLSLDRHRASLTVRYWRD